MFNKSVGSSFDGAVAIDEPALQVRCCSSMTGVDPTTGTLGVRQAAFIGVGAMVGAGIFALLGAAGEVAGAAVWLSFLIAGAVAGLQGYSFAKFGARYPSAGGLLEYVVRGFGDGHVTGVIAWLILAANAIVTGMVAVSFGSYASSAVGGRRGGLDQGLRGAGGGGDDDAQRRRITSRRTGPDGRRRRRDRHPHRVRGVDTRQHGPRSAGLLRATRRSATSWPAWR